MKLRGMRRISIAVAALLTVSTAGFMLGKFQAASPLVTSDEINTVEVTNKNLKALVRVIARIPKSQLQPGDLPEEVGSGFFYKSNRIITNYHVVQYAESIQVELADGRIVNAKLDGIDPGIDIAILAVSGVQAPATVRFGSSNNLIIGQKLILFGSPFGVRRFVSTGELAAVERTAAPADDIGQEIPQMLMTTAFLQRGNSGGPILNSRGVVVGVADAMMASNTFAADGSIGLGIPIDVVKESIQDLEQIGISQRGSLGITMSNLGDLEPIIRKQAGITTTDGAVVEEVPAGSLGQRAGLRGAIRDNNRALVALGDVIVAVDNQRVKDQYDVVRLVAAKRPGQKLTIKVWRNKKEVNLTATVVKRQR